jgi:hypothetical protein
VPDREVVSPNLNALVAEGVHLTRHYVHQFWCVLIPLTVANGEAARFWARPLAATELCDTLASRSIARGMRS